MIETFQGDFVGAKTAIIFEDRVLTILRDDIASIPFPNMWDLPGGGREGQETPLECLQREVLEEVNLVIKTQDIISWKFYPSMKDAQRISFFMVAKIAQIVTLRLGDEGQCYRWMKLDDFIGHQEAVPYLSQRLQEFIDHKSEWKGVYHG